MVVVDTIAKELSCVNDGNVIPPNFRFLPNKAIPDMIGFRSAFEQLSNILSRDESLPPTPQNLTPFTTPPTQIIAPPYVHGSSTQLSYPIDPQYSSGSTASSRSNESGREPVSSLFAINFLQATFQSIEDELNNVAWYRLGESRIKAT